MGKVIRAQDVLRAGTTGLQKPIIYCRCDKATSDRAVSINLLLAKLLDNLKPRRRTMQLENCLNQVLEQLPENPVIKDFDVMFNPEYRVDVLKVLVLACKKRPFSAIWPGNFGDGKLFYAEEGYKDYCAFNIENYDVTCVV